MSVRILFENTFVSIKEGIKASYRNAIKKSESSELAQRELRRNRKKDLEILNEIHDNLRETMEYYNYKNGLTTSK